MGEQFSAIDLSTINPALLLILISAAGAVVPLAVLALSSFIKLNIVFSILRNAIGGQNIPPASLVFTLSIVLTVQIMGPVWAETGANLLKLPAEKNISGGKVLAAFNPLHRFLEENSSRRERTFFARQNLTGQKPEGTESGSSNGLPIAGESVFTIIPAFVITEVSEAFTIGFIIYVPFLIIDLVVSNILLSLGMSMINPTTISLPVKLVLFVICEGWLNLVQGLLLGYVK